MTDVEQIKQKIDAVTFISEYVVLKKTGANFRGLCPFHSEKTPSFMVSPERQIWHCFGGCQEGGDIFKFLMKVENIEFTEALKILAKRAGVKLTSYAPSKTTELREKIFEVNHLASEFYQYILVSHPLGQKARDYLRERRISPDSIRLFGIGYAPDSWDSLMKFLEKKGYTTGDMEAAGLVSRSNIGNFFDRFRGRVIFTLKDHRGNVVGFAGRLMDPDAKEAKYINTAETAVYVKGNVLYGLDVTRDEIKKAGFAVVTEGEIDAIQSYQSGVRNVVAIKGSALTEEQVNLLKRYTENIYLSLDTDFAGDAAAHRGIATADAAGLNIRVVNFTGAKDPDELIKKDPGQWRSAVEQAGSFYDYIIDSALAKHDAATPEGAKKIVAEVAKFIEPIANLVVKNHYLKRLSRALSINEETLSLQIAKEFRRGVVSPAAASKESESKKTTLSREEYLLALLLQSPSPADYLVLISPRLSTADFTAETLGEIYRLLVSFVGNPKSDISVPLGKFEIKAFVQMVPPELLETMDKLYLVETKADPNDDQSVLTEIQKTAWDIKELSLRNKMSQISDKLKKGESEELEREFNKTELAHQKLLEEKTLISRAQ